MFQVRFVFPAKMGLNSGDRALVLHTLSRTYTYTITECLSALTGFSRSGPIYCHPHATKLLMPTAYRNTLWYRNLFIMSIQEMTHMRSIPTHEKIIECLLEKFSV